MTDGAEAVAVGRSAEVARCLEPGLVPAGAAERPITVDQTNRSVVVGEAVVVKWLRPPVPAPSMTVTLLRHLTICGFTEMPRFLGAYEEDGSVAAMVTGFVDGALDGWDWFVDELVDALDIGSMAAPLAAASALGAVAGRMHRALATPSSLIPEPLGTAVAADEHSRGTSLLTQAIQLTTGPEGDRLAARVAVVGAAIDAIADLGPVPVQYVHGDLHVGQFLRSTSALAVNDFDGNPLVAPLDRHRMRSPMVDLASLMQSVDHVGRIVARRRPEDSSAITHFIVAAVAQVAAAHREICPPAPNDDVLLLALRAIQELHEYVYAATTLPRWLYVPDAALTAMFG
jgi:maltokinase